MTLGVQQTLLYIFDYIGDAMTTSQAILANGLTLILVGTPLWVFSWRTVQKALSNPHEQRSLMRVIILSLVNFVAQIATLAAAGMILYVILDGLLEGPFNFTQFITI